MAKNDKVARMVMGLGGANRAWTGAVYGQTASDGAELRTHLLSSQSFLPIGLHSLRKTTAMNVANAAGNGGVLANDTTPSLTAINGATDGCQHVLWGAGNIEQVAFQTPLPPDLDTSADINLHFRIASSDVNDAVGFTTRSFFNEGDTAVAGTSGTNQTATYAEVTATIAAADVPSGAQSLSVVLTPAAHTTDTMSLTALWIEYTKQLLTS